MNDNIVASLSEIVSPEIIGKLATASGMDRSTAGEAVNAAVPALLSCLADLVTKPGGSRKLMSAVSDQSDGLDSYLSNWVVPAQAAAGGNSVLTSLLGGSIPNSLASRLAVMLGVNTGTMQTLLGMITPLVLGGLSRLQRARGLDANGLAQFLGEQKENIENAIPSSLSTYLRKSGLADGGGSQRYSPGPELVRAATAVTTKPRREVEETRGASWPLWALVFAAAGALLWALVPSQEDEIPEASAISSHAVDRSMLPPPMSAKMSYIARPEGNWKSIGASPNEYVNRVIYNPRGEALGSVRDVMVGPDGRAAAAILSVGQFLGIGDKDVAVPFSALRLERREGDSRVVIDVAKEALQAAPQYENIPASER